jgi:hypothetical protein
MPDDEHNVKPETGYVPDAKTAVAIAEAVWLPIYGESVLDLRPWTARLVDEVWLVEGTRAPLSPGGVPLARISKRTGEILRISHSR